MASMRGGPRPGAGRKKGGVNRATQEALETAKVGGELPLDYLLRVMRDEAADEAKRIDCAKAAAPYVHTKLNAVTLDAKVEADVEHRANPEDAERALGAIDRLVAALAGNGAGYATETLPE